MANPRHRTMHARLADLERRADRNRPPEEPRAVISLPRKDGDDRPPGVLYRSGPAVVVLYDPCESGVSGSGR